jgi:ABC-2 type transport system ATP-binding protein
MRQRLAIALAILHRPQLLILDEPTNGLDPAGVAEVRALIGNLARDGTTVFLSTHVLTEVEQVCDRVAILDRGRIVAQSSTADLLRGDGAIRLRFDGPDEARQAEAALRGAGRVASVKPDDDRELDVAGAAGEGSTIVRQLAAVGVYPAEVRADRATLEAVFLELTRDAPGDADATAHPGPVV